MAPYGTTLACMASVPSPITGYAFTPDDQRKGARKGLAQRDANLAERGRIQATATTIARVVEEGQIGSDALAVCATILERADQLASVVEADSALDLQRLAETAATLHKIHRLVTGQSTSNALTASVDAGDIASRKAELRARLDAMDTTTTSEQSAP